MAVSEKIQKKISELDKCDEKFKELMLNILEEEANGTYKIKIRYEDLVNQYIKEGKVGVFEYDKDKQD